MTIEQFFAAAAPYIVSILAAVASYVVGRIKAKSLEKQVKSIEDYLDTNEGKLMWIVCPNCGSKLYLCNLEIGHDTIGQDVAQEDK